MIRCYLKLVPLFATTFLALTLTASALGTIQPPNPALRGFTDGCEDKPQPCWYGIVPGVTTVEEAKMLIERFSPNELACTKFWDSKRVIYQIGICIHSRIGDLILYFGNIHKLFLDPTFDVTIPSLLFQGGYVEALPPYGMYNYREYHYSPFDSSFSVLVNSRPPAIQTFDWHGFISLARYCQLASLNHGYCERLK